MIKTREYSFTDDQMIRLLDVVRQVVVIDRCDVPESFETSEFQHLKVTNKKGHNDCDLYADIVSQTLDIPNLF